MEIRFLSSQSIKGKLVTFWTFLKVQDIYIHWTPPLVKAFLKRDACGYKNHKRQNCLLGNHYLFFNQNQQPEIFKNKNRE